MTNPTSVVPSPDVVVGAPVIAGSPSRAIPSATSSQGTGSGAGPGPVHPLIKRMRRLR
jgi:hypothetical protein